jgi:hypothetical protein
MSAYVGDVLSFYIDQQYREMMLPLAEERKNVMTLANTLGYRPKAISPAYVDLTFSQLIPSNVSDPENIRPDYDYALVVDKSSQIQSSLDGNVRFETLDVVDFTVSGAYDPTPEPVQFDVNGVVSQYKIKRKVKALSGETKTTSFPVGIPQQYKTFTLSETNIIEIIDVYDSNGNRWYEVDYLAQDRVKVDTHYTDDWVNGAYTSAEINERIDAYSQLGNESTNLQYEIASPYTLQYLTVSKKFITQLNEDNTTSLIFGNGLLRTGTTGSLQQGFNDLEQVGITVPGEPEVTTALSPVIANSYSSLGEIPSHTTLTIRYRVGGGLRSNVPVGDLTTINNSPILNSNNTGNSLTSTGQDLKVTNETPARGGSSGESIAEIKENALAFFTAQNRCVTKEDYESRVLSLPAKYGNIAKVYVDRADMTSIEQSLNINLGDYIGNLLTGITNLQQEVESEGLVELDSTSLAGYIPDIDGVPGITQADLIPITAGAVAQRLGTLNIYMLSYNVMKTLVQPSTILKQNLKHYLQEFKILTDEVNIMGGWIINFGVVFDVTANKSAIKHEVKLRCITELTRYFNVTSLNFKQPIFTADLELLLLNVEGVRSVNFVELTQGGPQSNFPDLFPDRLSSFTGNPNNITVENTRGYGWQYDFNQFYTGGGFANQGAGVIAPSQDPSVFELKYPNENIKGVVR